MPSGISSLTPDETGFSDLPEVNVRKADGNSAIFIEGYLLIPADGEYYFALIAGLYCKFMMQCLSMLIMDISVVQKKNKSIKLKAGLHPFRISYLRGNKGKPMLNLEWSGPGINKQSIPATTFFR